MGAGEVGRKAGLLGEDAADGKALNLTYYNNMYKFEFVPTPEDADARAYNISSSDTSVLTIRSNAWEALKAGSTILTVKDSRNEADDVKIKVTVHESVYAGVSKAEYDAITTAQTNVDWEFDVDDAIYNIETAKAQFAAWNLVVNKTTSEASKDGNDDGNQKFQYMGDANKRYAIIMESRIDPNTPVKVDDTLALIWTKATIPATAEKIHIKTQHRFSPSTGVDLSKGDTKSSYRITMVEADGKRHVVTVDSENDDWKTKASNMGLVAGGAESNTDHDSYDVPQDAKGKTVAIVIESKINTKNVNCEQRVKGVWITATPNAITLAKDTETVAKGASAIIRATVSPKAENSAVTYTVTTLPQGAAAGKVTIDSNGVVSVADDAQVGDYVITVASQAVSEVKATYTLTVEGTPIITSFTPEYFNNAGTKAALANAAISAKAATESVMALKFGYVPDKAATVGVKIEYQYGEAVGVTWIDQATTECEYAKITLAQDKKSGRLDFLQATEEGKKVTFRITPKADDGADKAITFNVTVTAASAAEALVWSAANKGTGLMNLVNATDATKWSASANSSAEYAGEGARIFRGYISKTVDLTDRDWLVTNIRTYGGNNNAAIPYIYVELYKDGALVARIAPSKRVNKETKAVTAEGICKDDKSVNINVNNTLNGDTFDTTWDTDKYLLYYDLSQYTGEYEIRIGVVETTGNANLVFTGDGIKIV